MPWLAYKPFGDIHSICPWANTPILVLYVNVAINLPYFILKCSTVLLNITASGREEQLHPTHVSDWTKPTETSTVQPWHGDYS